MSLARSSLLAFLLISTTASAQTADPLAPLPTSIQPGAAQVQVHRASPLTGFEGYKQTLASKARAAGIRETTIANVIPYLTLDGTVMRLDRAQPGNVGNPNATPPFAPYRRRHVTPELISRGRSNYYSMWPYLSRIEQRYGVPASITLAIWGKETSFGRVKGTFDVLRSLATLAYEGRRRTMFEAEFIAAMKLIDQGVPRSRLKGSWAGAMGHPQFMPTNVLSLRADGDGDGDRDIWGSQLDGLASIANYFRSKGWRPGMLWGIPVRVPYGFDRAAVRPLTTAAQCPRVHARHSRPLTMREWRAKGIVPLGRSLRDDDRATLFEADGPGNTAYLVTDNYRVILDYNCSNFYALSVALLADGIIGR